MGSLSSALLSSAGALRTVSQTFDTISNNITNANTPGYAEQEPTMLADPFDPAQGLAGGVSAGPLLNTRSEYLEQAVRTQQTALGSAQQSASDLAQVQNLFSLTADGGVANSLNGFFSSLSQLTVNPNDEPSRQAVITQAGNVAQSLNQSAAGIAQVSTNVTSQTNTVVTQINQYASQIANFNQQIQTSGGNEDEGIDTGLHNALENLSQLANISTIKNADGSFNVYLGGQAALVLGADATPVSVSNVSNQTKILDASGNDVTSEISSGQLGALITEKNTTLPSYVADLNTLSQSLADTVNTTLAGGVDENGNTPTTNLFTYNAANPAGTIAVSNITPDQIAAAAAGAPGGNGNAIALAQLANAQATNGFTFTQYYGNLGARVGNDVSNAQQDQSQAQDQLTQAQTQRTATSGVDLNAEAAKLMQFQQAYQAVGKMVSVLDGLTDTVMNMVQPSTA